MSTGSMFGWDCPASNPEFYNEDGKPKRNKEPMDNNQYDLLHDLKKVLSEINRECLVDEEYNLIIGKLGIFQKSIDEHVTDIQNFIDSL
jgi:hypothetical protein